MLLFPRPRSGAQEGLQLLQKSYSVYNIVWCLFNSPQLSSLQAGGGSDSSEREDASNLLSEWCVCVFLLSVDYKDGVLHVHHCDSVLSLQLMKLL